MKLFRASDSLRGRNVLVMGLGTKDGGVGAALFSHSRGAAVTVTDLQDAAHLTDALTELEGLDIRFVLGRHRIEDFISADLVIRNPGIKRSNKYLAAAENAGVIVESPIGLFCEITSRPWMGITGTKGKSFTTHLVSHLLQSAGIKAEAAGNNCVSPLRLIDDYSIYPVLELSSWQLREMNFHRVSPHTGCWLNFFADHMNWYDSMGEYRTDKESILNHQNPDDTIILPLEDPILSNISCRGRRFCFSSAPVLQTDFRGCCVEDGWITWRDAQSIRLLHKDSLPEHMAVPVHFDLIPPAVCCAVAAGADPDAVAEGLVTFPGIQHRYQAAGQYGKIRFINDSASTTPDSVIKAILSGGGVKLVLIAGGGGHKDLDYAPLAPIIRANAHRVILFRDDPASAKLREALNGIDNLITAVNMSEAVQLGIDCLDPREESILLLSPGCSGAPFYVDLFERGEKFLSCVSDFAETDDI